MNVIYLLTLAIVGSFIGWGTNRLAVKLLFRPLRSYRIPIINVEVQGLIPKRKKEIAKIIGRTIENDFISIEEIIDEVLEKQRDGNVMDIIKTKLRIIASKKMPTFLPRGMKEKIHTYIDDLVEEEGENMILELIDNMSRNTNQNFQLATLIEDKINRFPIYKLETIVQEVAKKELKHIEILGGVLGFIIGLIQGSLVLLL
ncbi:DUF445 domain-containing protein [Isachenkonia alkalipeptolytica]|uniref:DUF445 family protein n=1 Tax=Isachenkonia alkalipeptolytica TaxID=2565777 RepID=A0AA43XML9_9CLOT|nr:DUF445 family protein [Isachenkonia alkalipeptolytica]NBG89485.1 DUF445 family protein [Isachenkonia alkalipeptolytica]